MDLAFVLLTLRRAWWLLLLTATLGLAGAVVVNVTSPAEYSATVQQFVSMTDQIHSDGTSSALSGSQFAMQRVKSYTQIATSSQVLGPVISRLHLPITVADLADRVQATNPLDTVLIQLSVTDVDPQRAAATANAISAQLGTVVQDIEAPAGGGVSPVKVTVTEPATVPTTPVSPKVTLNLALGLLVGLGLGAGGALLRAQLDTRIAHVGDVETLTGRAPLGVVPFDAASRLQPLIAADQGGHRAESFRTLRTNLRFADVDNPPRVLVITSALPGEGKSTTACNVALTLALNGSRVVLIEGDLRAPRVCRYLGLDSGVGLTNLLAGQHGLADVLVRYQAGLLTVLPAGPVPPNPSELLGSQQLAGLIRTLAGSFDYVIIDAAPLLPVTDAAVLATAADGALVVVRHSRTKRDELQRALQALTAANARVLGTVVNFAPARRRSGGGYGYGYGGYGRYVGHGRTESSDAPAMPAVPVVPLPATSAATTAATTAARSGPGTADTTPALPRAASHADTPRPPAQPSWAEVIGTGPPATVRPDVVTIPAEGTPFVDNTPSGGRPATGRLPGGATPTGLVSEATLPATGDRQPPTDPSAWRKPTSDQQPTNTATGVPGPLGRANGTPWPRRP